MDISSLTNQDPSAEPHIIVQSPEQISVSEPIPAEPKKPRRKLAFLGLILVVALAVIGSFYAVGRAPTPFPSGIVVTIPPRSTVKSTAALLERSGIIRSPAVFDFLAETIYINKTIIAGQFQFDEPVDTLTVLERVTGGVFGQSQVKITIPEGSSISDISQILSKNISAFDTVGFAKAAGPYEGSLFPETYFFFKDVTPNQIVDRMRAEFGKKILPLQTAIIASGHNQSDIVAMASILEKEAKNSADAARIAGILWHRFSINMDLQVDAAPSTYTHVGLPVAIGNPGLVMIDAAIHPVPSVYLYYLYDKHGVIHYAKTYAEHQVNIKKYLK